MTGQRIRGFCHSVVMKFELDGFACIVDLRVEC